MRPFWSQQYRVYQELLLPTLVMLAIAVLSITVLVPFGYSAVGEWQELSTSRKMLGQVRDRLVFLTNLDAAELTNEEKIMVAALPNSDDLGYFLAAARTTAHRAGANFLGVELVTEASELDSLSAQKAEKPGATGPYKVVQMKVKVGGGLAELEAFLRVTETVLPLNFVNEFTFRREQQNGVFGGSAVIQYAYVPLPKNLPAVDSALPALTSSDTQTYRTLIDFSQFNIESTPEVPAGNEKLLL